MATTLVEYIREQLKAGYTKEQIREYLTNYGYPQRDVDISLDAAEHGIDAHPLVQQRPLSKHPFILKIMIVLAVITFTGALLVWFNHPKQVQTNPITEEAHAIILQEPAVNNETKKIPEKVQNRIDKALADLKKAEQTRQSYDERLDYLDSAITNLRILLQEQPNSSDAHNFLGDALEAKGLYSEAETEYKTAMKIEPDNPELYNDLGFLYEQKGDIEKAKQYYEQSIQKDPTFDVAYSNLGMYYYQQGDYDEAIKNFITAKELRPYNYKTINNLGFAYYKKNLTDKALAEFKQALDINPEFANPYFGIGMVYVNKEDYGKAVYQLEKSVVLDPNNFIYQEAYSRAKKKAVM